MYLAASTRCGISAKQMERELGVTYKQAHKMMKPIRMLMGGDGEPLSGDVEIDETSVGGKTKQPHGPGRGIVVGPDRRKGSKQRMKKNDPRPSQPLPASRAERRNAKPL